MLLITKWPVANAANLSMALPLNYVLKRKAEHVRKRYFAGK